MSGSPPTAPGPFASTALLFGGDFPHVGLGLVDPETGRFLDANATLCAMLGYTREELFTRTAIEITHPDDRPNCEAELAALCQGQLAQLRIDKRYLRKDGTAIWVSLDVRALPNEHGPLTVLGAVVDITERVLAEQQARQAAALLERLSANVPGILYEFVLEPDGRTHVPYSSRGLGPLVEVPNGWLRHDASKFLALVVPEFRAVFQASIEASARALTPWALEFQVEGPRGRRWLRGESRPVRRETGAIHWYGLLTDVTHLRAQQQALADNERQLRFLFEHAAEGILVLDADTGLLEDANPAAEAILGYPRDALVGHSPLEFSAAVQPNGLDRETFLSACFADAMSGRAVTREWYGVRANGITIPCEVRVTVLPVEGRRLLRSTIVDISERVTARAALERLQQAIDSSMHGVAMADPDGIVTYVNPALLAMWGLSSVEEAVGRPALSFWRDEGDVMAVAHALEAQGSWSGELMARRRDGRERVMQLNASSIRDAQGAPVGMLASFVDVTDTRRLEQELQQAQKLESVGRLAGGVAHDFNNLLTVIKTSIDLALSELPPDSAARTDLREVARATDSAARLTQQLLAFSRKQVIAPTTLSLNEIVQRVAAMLQRLLGEDILLRTVTAHDLGFVRFDAGQAEQILVNMAVNARDAMPRGGTLTIETRNVHLDEDFARYHPGVRPADYVLLTVNDTGEGMPPEVLEHAFEPFFTTKAAGKGTGLGLAVIHGVVTQNGGRVDVSSSPGAGTTFRVYLPRVTAPLLPPEPASVPPLPRGSEVILLVEDDGAVRQLMTRLLHQQGYRVFAYERGQQALDWLSATTEAVDLLLTDVIMPGMNGKELADAVTARRPGTRVLFASGYTANVIAQHGVLDPDIPFLPKPFAVRELVTKVREAIDGVTAR